MTPVEIALSISLLAIGIWAVFVNRELKAMQALAVFLSAHQTRQDRRYVKLRGRVANIDEELEELASSIETFEPTEISEDDDYLTYDEGDSEAWKHGASE